MTQTRSPYYTVGGRIHLRAEDALLDHARSGDEYIFHPGCSFVENPILWQQEPIESVQELKKKRALQIREKYDYLILFWSGGTDSHTILKTFVENNIRLDKIIFGLVENWCTVRHWEFQNIIKPELDQYLKRNQYEVELEKIEFINHLEDHARGYELYQFGSIPRLTPNTFFVEIRNDDFGFRFLPPNSGVISGLEKPTVTVHQGFWCWQGLDQVLASQEANFSNEYVDVEEFFFSDSFPDLHIKLTWLKIRKLEEKALALIDLSKSSQKNLDTQMDQGNLELIRHQGAGGLLYEECLEAMDYQAISPWLQSGKSKQFLPGKWNEDLKRAYHHNESLLSFYSNHLTELEKSLPEGTIQIDKSYEGVVPVPKKLAGIWSNPTPVKPFPKIHNANRPE